MRKIIIGFDGSRAFEKKRTGTENYSYQLLKNLAKIDQKNQYIVYIRSSSVIPARHFEEVSTLVVKAGIYTNEQSSFASQNKSHGSRIKYGMTKEKWPKNFQFKEINWPRFWTQGGLGIQTFKDNLDVLFVPAHTLPIIKKSGLKTVVTVHDLGSEYLPSMHQLKQRAYLGLMQQFQLKGATKIIAVSKATKRDLVKRIGLEPGKIAVIYEGYDEEKFKVKSKKLKVDIEVISLIPYFLFVGTVQPRKNLERVIKAFAQIIVASQGTKNRSRDQIAHLRFVSRRAVSRNIDKEVRSTAPHFLVTPDFATSLNLVIVGQKGWLSDEIYKLPKKLGIEKRVKFLGYVPDKDLPALYSGAQALVFPSLFEGFGLPILEAQACGCPVITSDISSMPEVAGKGAILVNPYDVEEIANAMIRVRGERKKLVKAGFENIKRFSWGKCARETLAVLENI